jgi:hypothetical protein
MIGNHEVDSRYVEKVIIPGAVTITFGGGRDLACIKESGVACSFVGER